MNNSDATECGHSKSHDRFGDDVHGRNNKVSRKGDVTAKTGGEAGIIGCEVNVVREKD
ncbi:hypothetical protein TSUD_31650 [Trifolium subterraneum]|uniref:Uncharacterized protein n=1 Tax=Trifolium subterraneum TaxID=3900 RepID=A0A2Z6NCJ1_TRISU|nr:hypothetical protein TSUD_31650 [Trifolium subterraneum]